jgi:hypothetical protein
VLSRQLHPFPHDLFLTAFENPCIYVYTEEVSDPQSGVFRQLLEYFPSNTFSKPTYVNWVCKLIMRVATMANAMERYAEKNADGDLKRYAECREGQV